MSSDYEDASNVSEVSFEMTPNLRSNRNHNNNDDDNGTDLDWVPEEYRPHAEMVVSEMGKWYDEMGRLLSSAVDTAGNLTTDALEWTQDNIVSQYAPDIDITGGSKAKRDKERRDQLDKMTAAEDLPIPPRTNAAEIGNTIAGAGVGATEAASTKSKIQLRLPAPDSQLEREAAKLAPGQLWEDPAFPATDSSLGGDLAKAHAGTVWLRPKEFLKKPILIADGVEPGDVKQGSVGDCWFLGGLSVIATQPHLLGQVVCKDTQAAKGMYAFYFYKFGVWLEVIVDDRIPCRSRFGFQSRPLFAYSLDENELWVMLIEKAYAKLHGSYAALDGGNTPDAISDLTGSISSSINFKEIEADIQSGKFFKQLMQWDDSGYYLMGASSTAAPGQASEADMGNGIHVGHAYGVLNVVEYNGNRLIHLRNPWGEGEPQGLPWSDGDTRNWTPEALKALNHKLGNDGSFFMAFEDFSKVYTNLSISRLLEPTWKAVSLRGVWSAALGSAGGCPNYKTFLNNPQFALHVKERGNFIVMLSQAETRGTPYPDRLVIGLRMYYVGNSAPLRVKVNDPDDIVKKSAYINVRDISLEFDNLNTGHYTIIPSTFQEGIEGLFKITVFSSAQFALGPLDATQDFRTHPIPPINMATRSSAPQANVLRSVAPGTRLSQRNSFKHSASAKSTPSKGKYQVPPNKKSGGGRYRADSTEESATETGSVLSDDDDYDDDSEREHIEPIIKPDESPAGRIPAYVKKRLEQLQKLKQKKCAKCTIQ